MGDTEYIVTCGNKQYRAITPQHIAVIETTNARYAADERIIAAQADQITHLNDALSHAKAVEDLDARLLDLKQQIVDLKSGLLAQYERTQAVLLDVQANTPHKSKLEKLAESWQLRFGFAIIGAAGSTRTLSGR